MGAIETILAGRLLPEAAGLEVSRKGDRRGGVRIAVLFPLRAGGMNQLSLLSVYPYVPELYAGSLNGFPCE